MPADLEKQVIASKYEERKIAATGVGRDLTVAAAAK